MLIFPADSRKFISRSRGKCGNPASLEQSLEFDDFFSHFSEPNLLVRACNQLGQFLSHRETNLRYLALESMCLLATSEFSHDAVKKHQETVINALKTERDVSVRQRAVDLLYAMCDRSNSEDIVLEMLTYLETADYSIREEMVLKVAILAEKYATDYKW